MKGKKLLFGLLIGLVGIFYSCTPGKFEGIWDCEFDDGFGTMILKNQGFSVVGEMVSIKNGKMPMRNIEIQGEVITGEIEMYGDVLDFSGIFEGNDFSGYILEGLDTIQVIGSRQLDGPGLFEHPNVLYVLNDSDLEDYEKDLDHKGMIDAFDGESLDRGGRIYNSNCINCHGNPEMEGSIPMSLKFWEQPFKAGNDPYNMYQTVTKGFGSMPPQVTLTPQEKYDVISYIRENYVRRGNKSEYFNVNPNYLAQLPKGISTGPPVKPYHPWSDMDYGNFFINTYELADSKTGLERYHSPGPTPFPDENYLKNNFAYKGIAVRLDEGPGGVSEGKAWMIFDHDVMRVAGGWTGDGFIDWNGILLNDQHETYPRTIGELHFETPVGPAWANPITGTFEDTRFKARDGRRFGPLPKSWADYKGIYHYENTVVISYTVGTANVLERLGMEKMEEETVFMRTLNIGPSSRALKMRIAPAGTKVALKGRGASLKEADGFVLLEVPKGNGANIKLFIAKSKVKGLDDFAKKASAPESLVKYTRGGEAHYPQELVTNIILGNEDGPIAMDQLTPPFDNPWNSRMKLSGIDFMEDANRAVACTSGGDIWMISGLTDNTNKLSWKRIGSGLFQPLGIKVVDEKIYVTCRDQIVLLQDLNGDEETDFYQSFNHDHQVTDHFHEFAMGLQTDKEGNFYYAKSGRHAREALIPQHGTLLKVSKDGSKTEIIATGFRAANGVCINPDGSFIVTDQQGYWNPMNRVNWVEGKGKFYGNMWGYEPPKDTTRLAMERPMVWIDMEFDRSPSELLWVDSKKWGPLDGGLLSFSYGYGKIQLVLPEEINNQRQAGVIDLPGIKFLSGVMRGRFNPEDGHLYANGMSAWGTSQMMRGGEFYRLRYTGKPLSIPVQLSAEEDGVSLTFAHALDKESSRNLGNFEVQTWDLIRSSDYGSNRHNIQTLEVSEVILNEEGSTIKLVLPEIKPVDVMTIGYKVKDVEGNEFSGKVQNTIHNLKKTHGSNLKKVPLG
ncbi:MAG: hypothetical protein COA50_07660 [Flavobacteriaceae bacterium]|nr:MAG: hypothetical protein COA50_07660 [Flavobacteriaceae bacterium]